MSIGEDPEKDESDESLRSDSIPVVLDGARKRMAHLLRLVRPFDVPLMNRLLAESIKHLERAAELTIEQAAGRAAAAVEPMIDDVQDLKRRVTALEDQPDGQAREVGDG